MSKKKPLTYYNVIKKEGIRGIIKAAECCTMNGCPASCILERDRKCVFASKDMGEWDAWNDLRNAVQNNKENQNV